MLHHAMGHITAALNGYLKGQFDLPEDVAVISGILDQDGSVASQIHNKLVVSLVNIEKDPLPSTFTRHSALETGLTTVGFPPLHLNAYVLISAHYPGGNYMEGLKFISHAALFFQGNPIYTHANAPDLYEGIEKIVMDMENLHLRDMSSLWSVLSGRYLPSILYKMRMITMDAGGVTKQVSSTKGVDNTSGFLGRWRGGV